jgi:hypothetical protein
MEKRLKRQSSLRSIVSFASRISQRSTVSLPKPRDTLACPVPSPQVIDEARSTYLASRGDILHDFNERRENPNRTEDMLNPVLSANGDIKSDFTIIERLYVEEMRTRLKRILGVVYGTDSLTLSLHNPYIALAKTVNMNNHLQLCNSPPSDDRPRPWGRLARHASMLKQSFSQLRAESIRSLHLARQPATSIPRNIIESDDMIMILNARGTALLNVSFRALSQQIHIVKLSTLALRVWAALPPCSTDAQIPFDEGATDEEKIWILQRLIQLIRDDIYLVISRAVEHFKPAERDEQQRHITVFRESMATWQKMMNRQIRSAGNYQHIVESSDDFALQMHRLREWCEHTSTHAMTEHCIQICREVPFTWNRLHDQGAEWVGPQLSDENDATVVKPVEVTWLQRRMNGLWFGIENEDPEVPGGVEEEYEWVKGYQEREMEMDGERWRRCKYRY